MIRLNLIFLSILIFAHLGYAQTVTIGNKVWSLKNLDVSTFRNGDTIPEAKTVEEWLKAGENKLPAWCYYNNDPMNGAKYGKLYNWYAVHDTRGLAPVGYHIATEKEWSNLFRFFGNNVQTLNKQMKTFFKSLPGGGRNTRGDFSDLNSNCSWWCFYEVAAETDLKDETLFQILENRTVTDAKAVLFYYNDSSSKPHLHYAFMVEGKAVRCVKD